MLWLAGRFGIDRLRNARVILPTNDFFPAAVPSVRAAARERTAFPDRALDMLNAPPSISE